MPSVWVWMVQVCLFSKAKLFTSIYFWQLQYTQLHAKLFWKAHCCVSCCCSSYSLPNTKLEAAIKIIYFGKDGQAMLSWCSTWWADNLVTEMVIYVHLSVWRESSLNFSLQRGQLKRQLLHYIYREVTSKKTQGLTQLYRQKSVYTVCLLLFQIL